MTTVARDGGLWQRLATVKPDERRALVYAFLCAATMFSAYAMLRPVRETMGITSGVRNLPALFWATFACMLIAQPVYGWLVSRYPLRRILPQIYLLFAAMLMGFYGWFFLTEDHTWIARSYFVWVSVFNLFIVAVFWSLMADVFESEQAARLFGMIAGGLSTGGLIGPALAAQLTPVIGTINLLPASALLLVLSAFIMSRLIGLSDINGGGERAAQEDAPLMQGSAFDAFRQVLRSPYLAAISVFVLLLTSVSTVLYLEQQRIVAAHIADRDAQTVLFARIDFWVQAASLVMQFFFFNRILKWFGFATAIGMVPALLIVAFALFSLSPSLAVIVAAMMARRIGEYGLTRPCRDMLFTVVARDEKYKAKNLIDTFVYRGGDALSASAYAGVVALASTEGQAAAAGAMGVVLCGVWLALALWLAARFKVRESGLSSGSDGA